MNERKIGVILTYINIFLNASIMLFFTPYMLKTLGQSEYGLFSLANSIVTYLVILDFGFGNAIVVYTNKFRVKKDYKSQEILYGTIFSAYIFMACLVVLIGILVYFKLDIFFEKSMSFEEIEKLKIMFFILIFNLAFSFIFSVYSAILTAYEKFFYVNILNFFRTLILPFCMFLLLFFGFKSISLVICITILNIFIFFAKFLYYKKYIKVCVNVFKFDFKMLKMVLAYSFFIFLGIIVDQVNWNWGQFIIGVILGSKEVAVFAIAVLLNLNFMMLSTAISGLFLPKISQMVASGASSKILTNEMIRIGRLQAYIVYAILFAFLLFGRDFIKFWAGEDYLDSYYLSLIIMFPLSIPLIQNLGLSILMAKNKYAFKVISTLIGSIFMIIGSIFLTKIYGYFGVAFCVGISFFVLNSFVVNWYYSKKIGLDIKNFWMNIFRILSPLFALFLVYYFVIYIFNLNGFKFLIFGLISFFILYFIIAYKFSFNYYEKSIFRIKI